jgi:hypothetical protein
MRPDTRVGSTYERADNERLTVTPVRLAASFLIQRFDHM